MHGDIACEGVDRGMDRVVRLGAGTHRFDVGFADAEVAEHGGMERHAIGVVDGHADRDPRDLTVHGIERRIRHRSAQCVEGGEQGRTGGGDGGQVGHEAEVGGDPVENRP